MNERSTDRRRSKETEKVYSAAEASGFKGMGAKWKWGRGSAEVPDSSSYSLYPWKKALEKGAEAFLSGQRSKVDPRIKELEEENRRLKEALSIQTQELMLLKKGCAWFNESEKGSTYSAVQRERITEGVEKLKASGIKKSATLRKLGVCVPRTMDGFAPGN